jgi:hypothetical protein
MLKKKERFSIMNTSSKGVDTMDKITILNPNKYPFEVEVIRYFVMSDAEILLYTLNEVDNDNNVRLYVTKIKDSVTYDLTDQEWTYVKATIRNIVNENREGKELTVRDLDYNKLKGLVVEHLKVFKLAGDVLPDLGANKKEFTKEVEKPTEPEFEDITAKAENLFQGMAKKPEVAPVAAPTPVPVPPETPVEPKITESEPVNYKAMYEEIAQEKKKLEEELFDLQSKTVSYQIKYDQIKQILEGEPMPKDNK